MSELRIKLMAREAGELMADAQILRRNIFSESHGAYLLDLLALEILLKCCVVIETSVLERGHDYVKLFLKLSSSTRKRLIESAIARMGPTADFSDSCSLLALYGSNFVNLRYPYEEYAGMSEREYLQLGPEWIERGARVDEASFNFQPNELQGLLFALYAFTEERFTS